MIRLLALLYFCLSPVVGVALGGADEYYPYPQR